MLSRSPYREMWAAYVQRQRGDGINQRAVSTFMAYALSDNTEIDYTPAQLKDRVARAFKGDVFTDETASLFISAFRFTHKESDELRRAVAEQYLQYRTREAAKYSFTGGLTDHPYRTLMTTLILYLDNNGLIRGLEVTETIQAECDGLKYLTPLFEGSQIDCEVKFGGTIESVTALTHEEAYNPRNHVWEIKIKLPRTLHKGELHHYRYRCTLHETLQSIEDLKVGDVYYNQSTFGSFDVPHYNLTMILKFDSEALDISRKMWNNFSHSESLLTEALPPDAKIYSASYPIVYKAAFGYSWKVNEEGARLAEARRAK